jgi:predicted transposase/invertase (TIGR01784 family)
MWAIFLACANIPEHRVLLRELIVAKEEMKMAYDLLTSISQDADERARYRARRKFQMDLQHNQIVSFEDGKREGKLEGERKGKHDGILEGERKAKLEDARNFLAMGVSLDVVVQCTGLSADQIQTPGN